MLPDHVRDILDRKLKEGHDCTQTESLRILEYFNRNSPLTDSLARDLAKAFPLEWDQWQEQTGQNA